jgi:hypothetical protein
VALKSIEGGQLTFQVYKMQMILKSLLSDCLGHTDFTITRAEASNVFYFGPWQFPSPTPP